MTHDKHDGRFGDNENGPGATGGCFGPPVLAAVSPYVWDLPYKWEVNWEAVLSAEDQTPSTMPAPRAGG